MWGPRWGGGGEGEAQLGGRKDGCAFRIAFLTNGRKHPLVQFVVCLTF